jgi:hypothetical protein
MAAPEPAKRRDERGSSYSRPNRDNNTRMVQKLCGAGLHTSRCIRWLAGA